MDGGEVHGQIEKVGVHKQGDPQDMTGLTLSTMAIFKERINHV